jgi:hypothetical protein
MWIILTFYYDESMTNHHSYHACDNLPRGELSRVNMPHFQTQIIGLDCIQLKTLTFLLIKSAFSFLNILL